MYWKRKRSTSAQKSEYEQLKYSPSSMDHQEIYSESMMMKGYIPVIVGRRDDNKERFMLPVKLFRDPCITVLLDLAEEEFGYRPEGVLRLPCDPHYFRNVVHTISKHR